MIDKHTVGRLMGNRPSITNNPLLRAQLERKNEAVVKHEEALQANMFVQALRDSNKPLLGALRTGNTALATVVAEGVRYEEKQTKIAERLLGEAIKSNESPPILVNVMSKNLGVGKDLVKHSEELNDLLYRTNVVDHARERKEDLEFLDKKKVRDIKSLEALVKIEGFLNPRKSGGGLIDKVFGGMKLVGTAVVGGAALGIGKLVKSIITGQAFMTAGAMISGTSRFLNDTVKFIGKPLGITTAAGSKSYFGKLAKSVPIIGGVVGALLGAVNAVKGYNNAAEVLGVNPEDLKISDKLAAGLGGFVSSLTFGLSDFIGNLFGYESTERAVKDAFDRIKSFAPDVERMLDDMVGFTSNAFTAVSDFFSSELTKYNNASSLTAYLKDAGTRLESTVKDVYASISLTVGSAMTQASTAIHDFFSTEDVAPDGTVVQRYLSTDEVISQLRGVGENVASAIGKQIGAIVSGTTLLVSTALDNVFKTEEVTPDGTVIQRYLSSREIADTLSNAAGGVVRSVITTAGKFMEGVFSGGSEGEAPDLRFPHERMRDFIRGGFELLSKAVNTSILFTYNMVANAITSFFDGNTESTFEPSMLTEALKEIGIGVVNVFTGAITTLAGRLWESVSSPAFTQPLMDSISKLGDDVVAPLAWLIHSTGTHVTGAIDMVAQTIKGIDNYFTILGNGLRTFQDVKVGTEIRKITGLADLVVDVYKSVETTFSAVSWVSDFFLGVGRVASGFSGVFTMMADAAKFAGKFAWPIQVAVSIFDFFTGFSDAVSAERLGKDLDKLTTGDKLASGIGSVMKGLVDFPMLAINWAGKKLFGDWFDIGNGEDVGRTVTKGIERAMRIATGDATAGEVAQQLFEVIGFMPMTVGRWFLNNLFGMDIPNLENAGTAVKEWVDKKLAAFSLQESIIDPVVGALKGIGQWFSDTFSFENIKKLVTKSLQQVPGGQTVLEWMGVAQPTTPPLQPIASQQATMLAQGQVDQWQQQRIRHAEKNDVAAIEKLDAQEQKYLTERGLELRNGKVVPKQQFAPPISGMPVVPQAMGGAWFGGKIIPFSLGGAADIISQPTLMPMGSGNTALVGEAGYPEAIMPLQRMKDGKLGVHAYIPQWPKELDLRNVSFNLDENAAKSLGDKIGDALVKAYEGAAELFSGAKTVVTDAYHTVRDKVMGTSTPQVPAMPDMQRIGNDLLGQVEQMAVAMGADPVQLRKSIEQARPEFNKVIGAVQQQAGAMQQQMSSMVQPSKDSFDPHTVQSKLPDLTNKVKAGVGQVMDYGTGIATNVSNAASGAINSAVSGIDQFMAKTKRAESGGKSNAVSDTGATGLYQFTKGTWNDIATKHGDRLKAMGIDPQLITKDNRGTAADPRLNDKAQEAYMRILTENNAKALGTDDPGALYLAHFMGTGGAKSILNAVNSGQGGASAFDLLPENLKQQMTVSRTNMSVVGGKSAQQVLDWAGKKMGSTYDAGKRLAASATESGKNALTYGGKTADDFFGKAKEKAGQAYGAAKEALGVDPNEIKQKVMENGGTWTEDMASKFLSKMAFGSDAAAKTIYDVMKGDMKAAPNSSALLGGRRADGQAAESYMDLGYSGYSSMTDGSLERKRQGMRRMAGEPDPQTASGQMSLPPAPKVSYTDKYADKSLDWKVEEMQRRADELRRDNKRDGINTPPATPPTNPVPSIDSIPIVINDMGLVLVNSFVM